jgi:hypothetical protein
MYNSNKIVLKYNNKNKLYTNSTGSLTFDPVKIEAHSYKWWKFVAVVDGKTLFNNYNYSMSTSAQQYKIRQLMSDLGIKIDMELPIPEGIKSENLEDLILTAEEYLCDKIGIDVTKKQDYNERRKQKQTDEGDLNG